MEEFKIYWDAIMGDEAKEKAMETAICESLEEIRVKCPRIYYDAMYKMHCAIYGVHFNERLAKTAVSCMENADGTYGEHWTFEQTNQLAEQHEIKCKADFYYVLNMMYSDYGKIFGNETSIYVKLAKAYINDTDAPKGKVFNTWVSQMEKLGK